MAATITKAGPTTSSRIKKPTLVPPSISTVAGFVDYVTGWNKSGERPIAFRGQSFHGWKTLPKIFREDVGLYDFEKNAVRDLISIHPQEFQNDETMFDRLVRMQHFDLPTRLLDVTVNPLVALYFACSEYMVAGKPQDGKVQAFFLPETRQKYYDSDRVSCMANLANLTYKEKQGVAAALKLSKIPFNNNEFVKRLLWFVRTEKPHFESSIDPGDLRRPVFVKPKMSNRRIIAQSGAFIVYGERRLRPSTIDSDLAIRRIMVPAASKEKIKSQLELLGIHASALFPEIDKAADFIVKKYKNEETPE